VGGEERYIQGFVGKLERKRPFGRPRRRWKIILRWIIWKGLCGVVDWIELVQDKDSDGRV
jgi:hypothetical protein